MEGLGVQVMRRKKEGPDPLNCKVAFTHTSNVFPFFLCHFLGGGD